MLEQFSGILAMLATFFGVAMALGYFPQAYKIIKRKSSNDISRLTYIVFAVGTTFWLLYGISLNSMPLMIANAIGLIGVLCVVISCFYYRGAKK